MNIISSSHLENHTSVPIGPHILSLSLSLSFFFVVVEADSMASQTRRQQHEISV